MSLWDWTAFVLFLFVVGWLCFELVSQPRRLRRIHRSAYGNGFHAGQYREQRRRAKLDQAVMLAADRTHMPREDANPPARVSNIHIHRNNRLS